MVGGDAETPTRAWLATSRRSVPRSAGTPTSHVGCASMLGCCLLRVPEQARRRMARKPKGRTDRWSTGDAGSLAPRAGWTKARRSGGSRFSNHVLPVGWNFCAIAPPPFRPLSSPSDLPFAPDPPAHAQAALARPAEACCVKLRCICGSFQRRVRPRSIASQARAPRLASAGRGCASSGRGSACGHADQRDGSS